MRSLDRKEAGFFVELSKKYELPTYIIEQICKYPFKHAKKIIMDKHDRRDILLGGLLRLKLKPAFLENKNLNFVQASIAYRANLANRLNNKLKTKRVMKNNVITEFQHPLSVGDKFMTDFSSNVFTVAEVRETGNGAGSLYAYVCEQLEDSVEVQIILDVDIVGIVEVLSQDDLQ